MPAYELDKDRGSDRPSQICNEARKPLSHVPLPACASDTRVEFGSGFDCLIMKFCRSVYEFEVVEAIF